MSECKRCGKPIPEIRARRRAIYCSVDCAEELRRPVPVLVGFGNSSTTGALGELLAAAELIKAGFEVFRAISPASPFDLAGWKDGQLLRIEVKVGRRNRAGRLVHGAPRTEVDILAVVEFDAQGAFRCVHLLQDLEVRHG